MAIEGFAQKSCGSRFADAAGPRKQVRMVQTVVGEGVSERLRYVLLAGDLLEGLRSPFSGNYLVRHL
jgi:hypothetical protein